MKQMDDNTYFFFHFYRMNSLKSLYLIVSNLKKRARIKMKLEDKINSQLERVTRLKTLLKLKSITSMHYKWVGCSKLLFKECPQNPKLDTQ